MFEVELKNWLDKNGFNELNVIDDDSFMYDIDGKIIHFGIVSISEGIWFEQFEYEYGMEYCGIIPEVLAFLHEIGHSYTINYFNDNDYSNDRIAKFILMLDDYSHERMIKYWELPMEFSANMWVIDFVNKHITAVEELCSIYLKYYKE